ncbi:cytochrome C [Acuticoccus sediminis]|uniref:Cytochrome C n=1 Tax=Acuticoccus sediminis TaxID=2184697 RepID=A0A8B2NLP4_9HYPH|nr:cytochrome c [Acuticoccus sediminis]RAH96204.1 cytochrome C [Acuticoccus sediminis]
MKRRAMVLAGAAVAGLIAIAALAQKQDGEARVDGVTFLGEPVTATEIALGQDLYAANCASCHGASLEGQPDWRRRRNNGRLPAPPHDETGHTWHHSDQDLFKITRSGVEAVVPDYESDMPAFEGILTDAEIRAVLAHIKSTWPERERAVQAKITANDEGGS